MVRQNKNSAVQLKFCGLTTVEHFTAASELGVDFCGINLVPGSIRYLSPERAADLSRVTQTANVLVCRNPSMQDILEWVTKIQRVVAIQLHGNEKPEFVREIKSKLPDIEVWKALACGLEPDVEAVRSFQKLADLVLFDSGPAKGSSEFGGEGRNFDWAVLEHLGELLTRWGLAGGIRIDNLNEAIGTGAHLIDVASGIELVRGQKSVKLMREFVLRFRRCLSGDLD